MIYFTIFMFKNIQSLKECFIDACSAISKKNYAI